MSPTFVEEATLDWIHRRALERALELVDAHRVVPGSAMLAPSRIINGEIDGDEGIVVWRQLEDPFDRVDRYADVSLSAVGYPGVPQL